MQQNSNNTQFAISDFARNQPQARLKDAPIVDAFAGAPVYQQANGVNTFYTDDIQISDADIDNTFNRSNTQNNTQNSVQNTEIAYLDSNITNKFQQAGLSTNAESITIDDSTSSRLLKTDITANDIQNIDQIVEDGTITKTSSNEALVRSIIDNNEYTLKATVNENNIEVQDLSKRVLSQQELENSLENNVENSNKIEYNRQGIQLEKSEYAQVISAIHSKQAQNLNHQGANYVYSNNNVYLFEGNGFDNVTIKAKDDIKDNIDFVNSIEEEISNGTNREPKDIDTIIGEFYGR